MRVRTRLLAGWLVASLCAGAARGADTTYAAVKTILDVPAAAHGTWGILDRDGANRQVERYLSSLAGGEVGTGTASSPQFAIAVDRITFTVCGHDGQGGGRGRNLVRLVDAATGQILRETPAPGSDAMQERAWDVGDLKGRRVRFEVHDGLAEGAFAWLGVGAIDAGNALQVDFSRGMPQGWTFPPPPRRETAELLTGGIPFLRTRLYTVVPPGGGLEAPCGVTAVRLYVLGCTVPGGVPLEVYGDIKIEYRDGSADHVPLMYGFTVEGADKLMSVSAALHLHPSADPFQYYLAITPRPDRKSVV